jgi:hypothetical protein
MLIITSMVFNILRYDFGRIHSHSQWRGVGPVKERTMLPFPACSANTIEKGIALPMVIRYNGRIDLLF